MCGGGGNIWRPVLVGPVVILELRVVRVAVLHGYTTGEDGGHVITHRLPLGLLLLLLLHLLQLDACGRNVDVSCDRPL